MSTGDEVNIRTVISNAVAAFRPGAGDSNRVSIAAPMMLLSPELKAAQMVESRGVAYSLRSAASMADCFGRIVDHPPSGLNELDAIMAEYFAATEIPDLLAYYRAVVDSLQAMDTQQTTQGVPQ